DAQVYSEHAGIDCEVRHGEAHALMAMLSPRLMP
ncbi:hypothetical protein A2U01_0056199, partial [Trifolium medium]|nr:hypothetical protein [Trifolium medium]